MKNFWEKYKEFVVVSAYIFFVVCLILFAIKPLFLSIDEKINYIGEQKANQEIKQKKIDELPSIKKKVDIIEQKKSQLDVFIDAEYALPLIEELEKLAQQTGNKINIEVKDNDSEKKRKEKARNGTGDKESESLLDNFSEKDFITLDLKLEGDFEGIMIFLNKLENMKYFSDVISLYISKKQEDENSDKSLPTDIFLGSKSDQDISQESNASEFPVNALIEVIFYQ